MNEREGIDSIQRRGSKRRFVRGILIALACVVAVLLAGFFVLRAAFPPEMLRELVISRMEEATGLDISVEDASISFVHWRIGVGVSGVEISEGKASGAARLAVIPQAGATLAILPLLKRELVIEGVYINRPRINIVAKEAGPSQPGVNALSPAGKLALSIQLPRAVVTNATVTYEDPRTGASVTINGLDVESKVSAEKNLESVTSQGRFSVKELKILPPREVKLALPEQSLEGAWKVRFMPKEALLVLEQLSVKLSELPFEIKGRVRLASEEAGASSVRNPYQSTAGAQGGGGVTDPLTPGVELDVEVTLKDASLRNILSLAPEKARAKIGAMKSEGAVTLNARIRGRLPSPEMDATFALTERDALDVSGRATVGAGEPKTLQFESKGKLELGQLMELLPPSEGPKIERGEVSFDARGEGVVEELTRDPLSVQLFGKVNAKSISISVDEASPKILVEEARVSLSGRSVAIDETRIKVGTSSFDVRGRIEDFRKRSIHLTVNSPLIDLKEFLVPSSRVPAKEGKAVGKPVPLPVIAPGLSGDADLNVKKLNFGSFGAENLTAKIAFGGDSLSVTELKMNALGGLSTGRGTLSIPKDGTPAYAGNFTARNIQLNQLLSTFTPLKGLMNGLSSFEISVEGKLGDEAVTVKSIAATGGVKTQEARAIATPIVSALATWVGLERKDEYALNDFAASFLVQDGRVTVPQCSLVEKNSTWKFTGSTGLDGSLDHRVNVILSQEYSGKMSALKGLDRLLKDEKGRVVVDLFVGGTVKKPVLRWDSSRMEERAKEYLAGKVRDELERQKKKGEALTKELDGELKEKAEKLKEEATSKGKKLLEELLKKKKD